MTVSFFLFRKSFFFALRGSRMSCALSFVVPLKVRLCNLTLMETQMSTINPPGHRINCRVLAVYYIVIVKVACCYCLISSRRRTDSVRKAMSSPLVRLISSNVATPLTALKIAVMPCS